MLAAHETNTPSYAIGFRPEINIRFIEVEEIEEVKCKSKKYRVGIYNMTIKQWYKSDQGSACIASLYARLKNRKLFKTLYDVFYTPGRHQKKWGTLTESQITQIDIKLNQKVTQKEIARQFKTTPNMISRLSRRPERIKI